MIWKPRDVFKNPGSSHLFVLPSLWGLQPTRPTEEERLPFPFASLGTKTFSPEKTPNPLPFSVYQPELSYLPIPEPISGTRWDYIWINRAHLGAGVEIRFSQTLGWVPGNIWAPLGQSKREQMLGRGQQFPLHIPVCIKTINLINSLINRQRLFRVGQNTEYTRHNSTRSGIKVKCLAKMYVHKKRKKG